MNTNENYFLSITHNFKSDDKLLKKTYSCNYKRNHDKVFLLETKSQILKVHFLFEIYKYEERKQVDIASTYASILMHYALKNKEYEEINSFFKLFDGKKLSSWSLIAFLTSTYMYRKDISYWKNLYQITYNVLEREGENPEIELLGLERN